MALLVGGCAGRTSVASVSLPERIPAPTPASPPGTSRPEVGAAPSMLGQLPCRDASARCQRAGKLLAQGRALMERTSLAYGEGGDLAAQAVQLFELALEQVGPADVLLIERARAQLASGEAQPALEVLSELAERYPEEAEVQGAWGVALLARGQTEDARAALQLAVRLQPEVGARHSALGTVQFLLGMMDEAEHSYRAALSLSPGNAQVHGDLGSLLVVWGRVEEGREHLRRAIALAPERASYRSNLAYAELTLGELDLAVQAVRRALELDPLLVSAWLNLGLIEIERGDWDAAGAAFRRAQELAPLDPRPPQDLRDLAELRAEKAGRPEHPAAR